ncbi:GNAT family N-acetyltransferase [Verrucomicrobiales bacterium]|nr:GNAT family N-acetyltransferase [Verrucomicrobiales bacterium]
MSLDPIFQIIALDKGLHDRKMFDCGVEVLNRYLGQRARKEVEGNVASCFVITALANPERVLGFYTLSATAIEAFDFSESQRKKLPRYKQYPAVLLGRLAVDLNSRGKRIGSRLMQNAIARSVSAADDLGVLAIVTDPKDEDARNFYARFGFTILNETRLYLPIRHAQELLKNR